MLLYKWLGNTCVQSGELSEEVDHISRRDLNSLRGEIVSGRKILVKL